jgi:hypothetical protein
MADPTNADDNGSALNHLYDYVTGKLTPKGGAAPQDPNKVPIGDGLADKARQAIKGRQRSIDDAVAEAGG